MRHGVIQEGTQMIQKSFSPDQVAGKVRELMTPADRPHRILVAEDDTAVRGFLRTVLEQGGYEVVEAANGRDAIKEVHAGRVDLLITDLVMPVQEGIETIVALRKEVLGMGIIAISGALGGAYLESAAGLGADAVLKKPVNANVLLAKVAEVLKSRQ
jgi:DNA-binding response OmpR family regulator